MKRQFIKSLLMSSVLAIVVGVGGAYAHKVKADGGDGSQYFTQCDSGPQSIACGRWDMTVFDQSPGEEFPYIFWLRVSSVDPVSGSITGKAMFYFGLGDSTAGGATGSASTVCDTCDYTGVFKHGVLSINSTFYGLMQFFGYPGSLSMKLVPIKNTIFGLTNFAFSDPGSLVVGVRAPKLPASSNLVAGHTEVLFPATGGTLNDLTKNFVFDKRQAPPLFTCNVNAPSFPCLKLPTRNNWDVVNGEIVGLENIVGNNSTDFSFSNPLATKNLYKDFEVSLKVYVVPRMDSGIDLRGKYEVQITDPSVQDPFTPLYQTGAIYGRVASVSDNTIYNAWNDIKIRLVGRYVTVYVNDMVHPVINNQEIEGPTIVAIPGQSLIHDENDAGPITLDFNRMWVGERFKDIRVTPLYRK